MGVSRALFVTLVCVAAPSESLAQQIPVRSGAHETFHRIVLQLPISSEWSVLPTKDGAILNLPNHKDGFDTRSIFQLIDNTYIESLSTTNSTLDLIFSCDCVIETFVTTNNYLAMDIKQKPENPNLESTLGVTDVLDLTELSQSSAAVTASSLTAQGIPDYLKHDKYGSNSINGRLEQANSDNSPRHTSSAPNISLERDQLASQVGRAVSAGLLDVNQGNLPPAKERTANVQAGVSLPSENVRGLTFPLIDNSEEPGTSISRFGENHNRSPNVIDCTLSNILKVEEWASDENPSEQISSLRSDMFSEQGRLRESIAVQLAKLYIHLGFGFEARAVLSLIPNFESDQNVLLLMSDIIQHGFAKNESDFSQYSNCDDNSALWAVISTRSVSPNQIINRNAALRANDALPLHLRRIVAPELSRRLVSIGDFDSASQALRSIERTDDALLLSSADLLQAELLLSQGKTEEAEETLRRIVQSNDQHSASALVALVETQWKNETPVSNGAISLLEAYTTELKHDELGVDLLRARVLALASSQRFYEAFDLMKQLDQKDEASKNGRLWNELISRFQFSSSDVEFLEVIFRDESVKSKLSDGSVAVDVAERLYELGFHEKSFGFLSISNEKTQNTRARLLRASVLMDRGQFIKAEAEILGLDTKEAQRIRANLSERQADFRNASELFLDTGDQISGRRAAWLAENWELIVQHYDEPLSVIASFALTPSLEWTNEPGILRYLQERIDETARERSDLMKSLELP